MTTNEMYFGPSLISAICTIVTLIGLQFGYFRTHFNFRFLIIRHSCLLVQCCFFFIIANWDRNKLKQAPADWGIIFGFIYVLNQFAFLNVCWDVFSAFRKPFRTQKYALMVQLCPFLAAALMTIVLSIDKSKFEYRSELGMCWVGVTGTSTSLNPWNTAFFFFPSWLTLMTAGMTFCYVYWKLDVQQYLLCNEWHLYRFLKTERSSKINITFEVLIMFVGYMFYYAAIAFLYAVYYLFQETSSRSTYFLFCVVLQGSFEFGLIVFANICLYWAKARPDDRRRSSSMARAKLDPKADRPSYVRLQADRDEQMSFEFFLQKRVMEQLEAYIIHQEQQKDFPECIKINSYKKNLFHKIRRSNDISDEEYFAEFRGISRKFRDVLDKQLDSGQGGASGAIFCPTQSKRFYLKKLENNEANMLKYIIDDLAEIWIKRPTSLINRIFGLYSVKVMKVEVYFQVMEYLFYEMPPKKPTETYDLKGSEYQREVGSNPLAGNVLKDRDFRQPVLLSDDMKRLLSENIREDINFLAHCNLMDYSLLVGILYEEQHDESLPDNPAERQDAKYVINPFKNATPGKTRKLTMYSFGIIDYLQEWNTIKIWESRAKRLKTGEIFADESQISAVEPRKYCERFENKVLAKLFGGNMRRSSNSTSRSINIDSTIPQRRNTAHYSYSTPQGDNSGVRLNTDVRQRDSRFDTV